MPEFGIFPSGSGSSSFGIYPSQDSGTITGSGTSGQVTYWNGTHSITGDSQFTYTGGNLILSTAVNTLAFKSLSSNIAVTGTLRLSHSDAVKWRNNANSADLSLSVNSTDGLVWPNAFVGGMLEIGTGAAGSSTTATIAYLRSDQASATNCEIVNNSATTGASVNLKVTSNLDTIQLSAFPSVDATYSLITSGANFTGGLRIAQSGNNIISLYTNSAEAMRIDGAQGVRIGTTSTISTAAEKVSILNAITSAATIPYALSVQTKLTSNSASSAVTGGARVSVDRVVTADVTDTNAMRGLTAQVTWEVDSGHTYTNSAAAGASALTITASTLTGAGAVASPYNAILIAGDTTTVTGRKSAIMMGAPTNGSVGNAYIADNAAFSGSYFINSTSANPSLLSGTLTAANIIDSGLSASCVVVSDGSKQLASSAVTSTQLAGLLVDQIDCLFASVTDATYPICQYAKYGFTINDITTKTDSGSATLAVKINGTNVTSLSAISVTSSQGTATATGANTVVVGDLITFVFSSSSSPVNFSASMKITRT